MIFAGISVTATSNTRPKTASLHLSLGMVHAAVFSAMQGTEICPVSCIGHSLGLVGPPSVKREAKPARPDAHENKGEERKATCAHRHSSHGYHILSCHI